MREISSPGAYLDASLSSSRRFINALAAIQVNVVWLFTTGRSMDPHQIHHTMLALGTHDFTYTTYLSCVSEEDGKGL